MQIELSVLTLCLKVLCEFLVVLALMGRLHLNFFVHFPKII